MDIVVTLNFSCEAYCWLAAALAPEHLHDSENFSRVIAAQEILTLIIFSLQNTNKVSQRDGKKATRLNSR